jgi:hypothetical protein
MPIVFDRASPGIFKNIRFSGKIKKTDNYCRIFFTAAVYSSSCEKPWTGRTSLLHTGRGGLGGTTTSPQSSFTLSTDKEILRENPVKSYFAFL